MSVNMAMHTVALTQPGAVDAFLLLIEVVVIVTFDEILTKI